jgi:hypothetical protein
MPPNAKQILVHVFLIYVCEITMEGSMKCSNNLQNAFGGCSRTYSTLCVYHDLADPQEITDILQLKPDRSQKVGDLISPSRKARISGWFLGTEDVCRSKDVQVHIRWILRRLTKKKREMQELIKSGHKMWIFCFWESIHGNGGPILGHNLIRELSEFPIDLNFDVWFGCSEETRKERKRFLKRDKH